MIFFILHHVANSKFTIFPRARRRIRYTRRSLLRVIARLIFRYSCTRRCTPRACAKCAVAFSRNALRGTFQSRVDVFAFFANESRLDCEKRCRCEKQGNVKFYIKFASRRTFGERPREIAGASRISISNIPPDRVRFGKPSSVAPRSKEPRSTFVRRDSAKLAENYELPQAVASGKASRNLDPLNGAVSRNGEKCEVAIADISVMELSRASRAIDPRTSAADYREFRPRSVSL